jgi:mono/diheme cytochrome c family protein
MIDLFTRYCIRCHGVDGRGIWDIPDVPNFSNPHWQVTRTDGELSRTILEGRGACMPPFRGTLSLEEACAMARYVRTFVPGTGVPKPVIEPSRTTPAAPARPVQTSRAATTPPLPEPLTPAPFAR